MEIKSHFKYKFILIPRRVAVYVTPVFTTIPLPHDMQGDW